MCVCECVCVCVCVCNVTMCMCVNSYTFITGLTCGGRPTPPC